MRRLAWQMENIWTTENVNAHLDALQEQLQTEMVKDQERWYRHSGDWEDHMRQLRSFAAYRGSYVRKHVQNYFGLTDAQMREYGFTA